MRQPQLSDTIIVSTQRSGLNWVRYCVEALTGRRTPGLTLLVPGEVTAPSVFDRTHDAAGITERADSSPAWVVAERCHHRAALLLLRDDRELFVRHAGQQLQAMNNFISNLRWFDAFAGLKQVAYYEAFTQDSAALAEVLAFLGLQVDLQGFDLAGHGRRSRGFYDHNQAAAGGAMTKLAPDDMQFHQRKADPLLLVQWRQHVRAELGPLFDKYLGRYS